MTLGDIWERFNIDHPADFKGHSLSVSDIVVLHQNDEDTAHYVDSIGFQQVPEFLQEQQTPVFDKLPPEQQQALNTRFTIEEENIVAIYAEDSRETTLENILAAMPYMDEDMRQLAAAAVNKLQAMTDSEFSEREFILTDEE